MTYTPNDQGIYNVPLVDFGRRLQSNFGLTIREHPAFDPVDNVHTEGSYHYIPGGGAIDIQDWRSDNIDGVDWRTRTGNLENMLAGAGAEVFGPNSGLAGHGTHLHLAGFDGGKNVRLNEQQYNYFFGGNAGGPRATFDGAPPVVPATTAVDAQVADRPAAVQKAKDYSTMSKAQLDSAYDAMRSDPAKAKTEGMKMHKAFFKR